MRKIITAALAVLILSLMLASAVYAENTKDMTVMIYMCGSDLERLQGSARKDIEEMLASGFDGDRVNVLLYTGGCRKWKTGFSSTENGMYLLDPVSGEAVLVASCACTGMGEWDTLSTFLKDACALYPAQEYALILWDHGAGPLGGVCFDELHERDPLTLTEMRQALADSPFGEEKRLFFIGFDACLMANAETAAVCAPYARYMIASEEPEPGAGWNYAFLNGIQKDRDGAETGRRIADLFYEALREKAENGKPVTMAVIDLDRVGELASAVDRLFLVMTQELSETGYTGISRSRGSVRGIARSTGTEYDLVDLWDLAESCQSYAPGEAQALLDVLGRTVVYSVSNMDREHGLSTYYPYYNKDQYRKTGTDYALIGASPSYSAYIDTFADSWMTGRSPVWQGLVPRQSGNEFTLHLSPEQMGEFAYARFTVAEDISQQEDEQYSFIYRTQDVTLDDNDTLHVTWHNTALYCTDSAGNMNGSYSIMYKEADGMILVYGRLHRGDDYTSFIEKGSFDDNYLPVYLRFRVRDDGTLVLVDALDQSEDAVSMQTQREVELDKWESFQTYTIPVRPYTEADGIIAAYEAWQRTSWVIGQEIDLHGDWQLRFSDDYLNSQKRIAVFTLYDIYGNAYGSEILTIDNPNVIWLQAEEGVLAEDEHMSVLLTGIALETRPEFSYVLHLNVTNKSQEVLSVHALDCVANERYTVSDSRTGDLLGSIEAGESADVTLAITAQSVLKTTGDELHALRFLVQAQNGSRDVISEGQCAVSVPAPEEAVVFPVYSVPAVLQTVTLAESVTMQITAINAVPDDQHLLYMEARLINDAADSFNLPRYGDVFLSGNHLHFSGQVNGGYAAAHTETLLSVTVDRIYTDAGVWSDSVTEWDHTKVFDLKRIDEAVFSFNEIWKPSVESFTVPLPYEMDLSMGNSPADGVLLLQTQDITFRLFSVSLTGQYLELSGVMADTGKASDIQVREGIWSDGSGAESSCYVTLGHTAALSFSLDPGRTECVFIRFRLPEGGLMPGDKLKFSLRIRGGDGQEMRDVNGISLTLGEEAISMLERGESVPADRMDIALGEESILGGKRTYLEKEILTEAGTGLTFEPVYAPLDEDEQARFLNGYVYLIHYDADGQEEYEILVQKALARMPDGRIGADLCGCVLTDKEDTAFLKLYEIKKQEGQYLYAASGILLWPMDWFDDSNTIRMPVRLMIGPEEGSVSFEKVETSEPLDDTSYAFAYIAQDRRAVKRLNDGRPDTVEEMADAESRHLYSVAVDKKDMQAKLRPVRPEDEVYIVFSLHFEDGSGYSTEPVPWYRSAH